MGEERVHSGEFKVLRQVAVRGVWAACLAGCRPALCTRRCGAARHVSTLVPGGSGHCGRKLQRRSGSGPWMARLGRQVGVVVAPVPVQDDPKADVGAELHGQPGQIGRGLGGWLQVWLVPAGAAWCASATLLCGRTWSAARVMVMGMARYSTQPST